MLTEKRKIIMRTLILYFIFLFPVLASASDRHDLWRAAKQGNSDKVLQLLNKGVDINATYRKGFTALHIAARKGHTRVISILLKAKADINVREDRGATPLFLAAKYGYKEAVQLLLSKGAKRDIETVAGHTPLEAADKYENSNISYILDNSSNGTSVAVLIDFHNKKLTVEEFNLYAPQALKGRAWKIKKINTKTYQGDIEKPTMHYRVKVSFHNEYIMIRYILGYNIDNPDYLQNLAQNFRSLSGL